MQTASALGELFHRGFTPGHQWGHAPDPLVYSPQMKIPGAAGESKAIKSSTFAANMIDSFDTHVRGYTFGVSVTAESLVNITCRL